MVIEMPEEMTSRVDIATRFPEPLDYPTIIFKQINACRESLSIDIDKYSIEVSVLEDLLANYLDDDYNKEYKTAEEEYKKNIVGLSANNPDDKRLINEFKGKYIRTIFRALIKLIGRSGFLPYKEIEGIIN